MFELKKNWQQIKRGRPGRRFQDLYERRRNRRAGKPAIARILIIIFGVGLMLLALVVGLVPGPGGMAVFILGLGIVSAEFRLAARLLDWLESRTRRIWAKAKRIWTRRSVVTRLLLGAVLLGLIGILGYLVCIRNVSG